MEHTPDEENPKAMGRRRGGGIRKRGKDMQTVG